MENDPTFKDSIIAAIDGARGKAGPYLTWLPDWLETYVVDIVAILLLLAAVFGIWKLGADLWHWAIWAPRAILRRMMGYEPPESETKIAGDAARRAEEAAQRTERKFDDLRADIAAQAKESEKRGESLPEDAIDGAVAAAQEVLLSNDPSKAEAQKAFRAGRVRDAEDALEEAFNREAEAAARLDDESTQLKAKAARTAKEKAALAAIRSVAEALRWYGKAAELDPDDFGTQIELTRLH